MQFRKFLFLYLMISAQIGYTSSYYLNDGSTVGDIYTSTTGLDNAARDGSFSQPYASLQFLYSQQDLDGGDTVYLDAGDFERATMLNNGAGTNDDGGSVGNYLILRGAGTALTTVSNSAVAGDALFFEDTEYIIVYRMTLTSVNGRNNDAVACWINASNIIIAECELNHEDVAGTAGAVQFLGPNCCVAHCIINSLGWGVQLEANGHHVFDNDINCNGNTSYGNAVGIALGNSDNDSIFANRVVGVAGTSYGIRVITTSTNNYIISNYFSGFDNGVFTSTDVPNNFLYNNSFYTDETVLFQYFNGWDIRNNILYTNSANAAHYCAFNTVSTANFPTTLDYNLYYHPNGARAWNNNGTVYNTFALLQVGETVEANGVSSDPVYTNTATGDLSITTGSPAESAGVVIAVVTSDVQPTNRNATNREIGAFEIDGVGGVDDLHSLPVEWLSFEGYIGDNEKTILNWATARELNNAFFRVLVSSDGNTFESIGLVQGAGTTSEITTYEFIYSTPSSEVSYYILEQVDLDGVTTNSDLVAISNLKERIYLFTKNNKWWLQSNFDQRETVWVTFSGINGVEYDRYNIEVAKGNQNTKLILPNITSGILIMRVVSDHNSLVRKVSTLK